jgi:carbonic anhydrase
MSLRDSSKPQIFDIDVFADVLNNNKNFVSNFEHEELTGTAKEGLAIVTCMDSRISPLAAVGMKPGDAKILRNAGARVTEDVLRTLVLASYLLGVKRILVMPHTDCRMAINEEADIHQEISEKYGIDTSSIEFKTVKDQKKALIEDLDKIRNFPLLNKEVIVGGAIYNVGNGKLEPINA